LSPLTQFSYRLRKCSAQLAAPLQQHGPQLLVVAAAVADVPLPGGDDLDRQVALLEELDRVHELPLAGQVTRFPQ